MMTKRVMEIIRMPPHASELNIIWSRSFPLPGSLQTFCDAQIQIFNLLSGWFGELWQEWSLGTRGPTRNPLLYYHIACDPCTLLQALLNVHLNLSLRVWEVHWNLPAPCGISTEFTVKFWYLLQQTKSKRTSTNFSLEFQEGKLHSA